MKRLDLVVPLTLAVLAPLACKKTPTDDASLGAAATQAAATTEQSPLAVPLGFPVSDELLAAASALASKVNQSQWAFQLEAGETRPTTEHVIVLAATDQTPAVAGTALGELSLRKLDGKHDAARAELVIHYLAATEPRLVSRAMNAAGQLLMGNMPNPRVASAVMDAARRETFMTSQGRWETLQAIARVNHVRRTPEMKQYINQALTDPVPGVVIEALKLLYVEALSTRSNPDIVEKVLPLLQHDDPGVRGQAALVLGKQSLGDTNAASALVASLADQHPYVRAQAAHALGWLNYQPAIHSLVPLAADLTDCRYEYTVPTMESENLRQFLRGAHHLHVAVAVQNALQRLGKPDLKLEQIRPAEPEVSLKQGATIINKWYAANKSRIPTTASAGAATTGAATSAVASAAPGAAAKATGEAATAKAKPPAAVSDQPAAATKAP